MSGLRQNRQAGFGDAALHKDAGFDARVVFVAGHYEGWDVEGAHLVFEREYGRAASLHAGERERGAERGVFHQPAPKLVEAERVFAPQLRARLAVGVVVHRRHAARAHRVRARGDVLAEGVRVGGSRARPGDDERARRLRVSQPEVERHVPPHRKPAHVSVFDAEMVEQPLEVVHRPRLRVVVQPLRHVRRRIAARVVGYDAIPPAEEVDLRPPRAKVARELMAPNEREAVAMLFVVEIDSVDGG